MNIEKLLELEKHFLCCRRPGATQLELFGAHGDINSTVEICAFSGSKANLFRVQSEDLEYFNQIDPLQSQPQETTREVYREMFSKVHNELKSGQLQKVILSAITNAKLESPINCFEQLLVLYPDAFVYILNDSSGIWIGATPELLLNYDNGTVQTHSLAGTLPIDSTSDWSSKEIHEQKLVTDYIVDTLEAHGCVKLISGPNTVHAGKVKHLRTEIEADINDITSLINDLHPTPAVCGLPKSKAFNTIKSVEAHDRELYTGYIKMTDSNKVEAYVNLRCMKVVNNIAYLYVGGGITADSNEHMEWEETRLKSRTLLDAIQNL